MTWTTRMMVACGGLAVAMAAATGTAGAEPDAETVVNSTCTYPQVMAALNEQAPASAADPVVTGWLERLVASPPDGRRAMVAEVQAMPWLQSYTTLIFQIAGTCNNY
jgi:hemophore-related protein